MILEVVKGVLSCFTLDELNNDLDETAPHFRAWKVEMSLIVHKAKLNPSDLTAIDIDSGLEEIHYQSSRKSFHIEGTCWSTGVIKLVVGRLGYPYPGPHGSRG